MSGRRSRDKGTRTERAIVRLLQGEGLAATKISGLYKPSADISMPLLGSDMAVEVKCRAAGSQLYDWLSERDMLIVKAARQQPLAIVGTEIANAPPENAEIANGMTQIAEPTPDTVEIAKAMAGAAEIAKAAEQGAALRTSGAGLVRRDGDDVGPRTV